LFCLLLTPFEDASAQCVQPAAGTSDGVATLRTQSRAVVVDVVVSDKNRGTVEGLKKEDFTILEDGLSALCLIITAIQHAQAALRLESL
jgi:Ni,Fe-hydrogenase maturation factor